jgi:hypothetical protein
MLTLVVVALQARAPLAARDAPYFRDSFASVRRLAEQIPPDGVVVLDGGLAELQIQVPLWLVFGRETALATVGGPAWRLLLSTIVASGRPTYWIQNRWGPPPQAKGLTFTAVGAESDMTIHLPNSPRDTPPAVVIRKIVPLRVYGVALEAGAAGSG